MNEFGHTKSDAQTKTLSIIGKLDRFLEKKGLQVIKRQAFCDWGDYPDAQRELYKMAVRPVHVTGVPGKNSADMELSLSVQDDLLSRGDIDAFVIVAGDRDYMPIAQRVKVANKALFFVSFNASLSGDLKNMVRPQSVFYIDPVSGDIKDSDWKPEPHITPQRKEDAKIERKSGLTNDEMVALRAAIAACDRVKAEGWQTFKVGVFLVADLAQQLNYLSHVQRKDVFSSLAKKGLVKTEMYVGGQPARGLLFPGEIPYAVFSINDDNETVKAARATMPKLPDLAPAD